MEFSKRRYSLFPKTLANGLAAPVAESLKKRGFEHEAVLHYWQQAAGQELAAHSCPIRFRPAQANRQSQLIVRISASYSTIAAHQSEQILMRLTQLLGHRPAERLVFVVG